MTPAEQIASLTKALAVERVMNGLKVKAGVSGDFARMAVEREVTEQMDQYPETFDPACPNMLKGVTDRSVSKCPAMFEAAGAGGSSGSGMTESQARRVELRKKGIL